MERKGKIDRYIEIERERERERERGREREGMEKDTMMNQSASNVKSR